MESLLGDNPDYHPLPRGQRRLLYLGIGCRLEALSPKSFFPAGFRDVVIRNGGCEGA